MKKKGNINIMGLGDIDLKILVMNINPSTFIIFKNGPRCIINTRFNSISNL